MKHAYSILHTARPLIKTILFGHRTSLMTDVNNAKPTFKRVLKSFPIAYCLIIQARKPNK